MGFKTDHRKLQPLVNYNTTTPAPANDQARNSTVRSESSCLSSCKRDCKCQGDYEFSPPLLLPPMGPLGDGGGGGDSHTKQLVTMAMIVMSCIIVGTLLLGVFCAAIRVYYVKRRNSRRPNPPITFGTQEDFFDEDHGPVLDHPIWYINTIGLSQSLIDSIALFKYKKDVGLIQGTNCSVCLSEFQEDESLRLLPKCSHAFHISCIDTWLRSHTNCPLCRAPIISVPFITQSSESDANPNGLDSRNEIMVVASENFSGHGGSNMGGGSSEARNGNGNDHSSNNGSPPVEQEHTADKKILSCLKTGNCDSGSRVLSDLAEKRWMVGEPIRRSVSLDSPAASLIYSAVAECVIHDKCLENLVVEYGKSKSLELKSAAKRGSGSSVSRKCRLMKSSSIGAYLHKGPMLMKRSLSSIEKVSSSRHSRQYSVPPF